MLRATASLLLFVLLLASVPAAAGGCVRKTTSRGKLSCCEKQKTAAPRIARALPSCCCKAGQAWRGCGCVHEAPPAPAAPAALDGQRSHASEALALAATVQVGVAAIDGRRSALAPRGSPPLPPSPLLASQRVLC